MIEKHSVAPLQVFAQELSAQGAAEILDFLAELLRSFQSDYADLIRRGYRLKRTSGAAPRPARRRARPRIPAARGTRP